APSGAGGYPDRSVPGLPAPVSHAMNDEIPTPEVATPGPVSVPTAEPPQPAPESTPLAPRAATAMIVFDQVTKLYEPTIAGLLDVSLQIDKGEFVFLVGPSGSGK